MGKQKSQSVGRRFPICTLLMVVVAIIAYAIPVFSSHMIYDRTAILSGEFWRLLTGNFVHFSASHLFYDLTVVSIAGCMIEYRGYPYFGYLSGLSALLIGVILFAVKPEMNFYGGFSGVACGSIIYLGLHGLNEKSPWRWICIVVIILTIGKIFLELQTGHFFIVTDRVSFFPVPLSHAIGALSAMSVFWWYYVKVKAHKYER